jgi:hypothetical protein
MEHLFKELPMAKKLKPIKPIPHATKEQKEGDWQVRVDILRSIDRELDQAGVCSNIGTIHDTIVVLHNMGYMRIARG